MYGIQTIDVVEPRPERCTLALQLGASNAAAPQAFAQQDTMYALGFECSSHNEAFELLQQKIMQEGRICILADGNIEPLILTPSFHQKELTIVGSSDGWDYQEHAKWYFTVVPEYISVLEQIFDSKIRDDSLISTFEHMASGTIRPVKVLVQYKEIDGLPSEIPFFLRLYSSGR